MPAGMCRCPDDITVNNIPKRPYFGEISMTAQGKTTVPTIAGNAQQLSSPKGIPTSSNYVNIKFSSITINLLLANDGPVKHLPFPLPVAEYILPWNFPW